MHSLRMDRKFWTQFTVDKGSQVDDAPGLVSDPDYAPIQSVFSLKVKQKKRITIVFRTQMSILISVRRGDRRTSNPSKVRILNYFGLFTSMLTFPVLINSSK